jgi:hypothetical protein
MEMSKYCNSSARHSFFSYYLLLLCAVNSSLRPVQANLRCEYH